MINNVEAHFKEAVEKKYGSRILDRGDCENLSIVIYSEVGQNVSYNTLRRIFGLAKAVTIRRGTLDLLSLYIGYQSYQHYLTEYPFTIKWVGRLILFEKLDRRDINGLVHLIETQHRRKENFVLSLINIIREFLLLGKIRELSKLLNSEIVNTINTTYNQKLFLGNSIGILLRSVSLSQSELKILCKSNFFRTTIFEVFVDYSNLNGHYFEISEILYKSRDYNNKLFIKCLYNLRAYLNMKQVQIFKLDEDEISSLHPILRGRYFSNFIFGDALLESSFFGIKRYLSNDNIAESTYEPILVSLLTLNFKVQNWILEQIQNAIKNNLVIQHHYLEAIKLLQIYYYIGTNNRKQAREIFETIIKDNFILSYKSFIIFFYHLAGYQLDVSKERAILLKQSLKDNPYKRFRQIYNNAIKMNQD